MSYSHWVNGVSELEKLVWTNRLQGWIIDCSRQPNTCTLERLITSLSGFGISYYTVKIYPPSGYISSQKFPYLRKASAATRQTHVKATCFQRHENLNKFQHFSEEAPLLSCCEIFRQGMKLPVINIKSLFIFMSSFRFRTTYASIFNIIPIVLL